MNNKFIRSAAAVLCSVMLIAGCDSKPAEQSTTSQTEASGPVTMAPVDVNSEEVALVVDGTDVSLGTYLFYEIAAESAAVTAAKAENPDSDINADNVKSATVEGKNGAEWIKDKTEYYCRQLVNIEKNFEKLGLALSAEEEAGVQHDVTAFWDEEDQRISLYFGLSYTTWGEYYTAMGIDRASYERACYASAKQASIFNYYYGENGIEKSSEEDVNAYIRDNIALCHWFSMRDYSFIPESEIKEMAEGFAEKINAGEMTVIQAKEEYLYFFKQRSILDDIAKAEAEGKEYTGDSVESVQKPTCTAEEVTEVIRKGDTNPTATIANAIFGMENSKAQVVKDGEFYYLFSREDILAVPEMLEKYSLYANHALNDLAFSHKFESEILGYEVTVNEDVIATAGK